VAAFLIWLFLSLKDFEFEHTVLGIVCIFFFWHDISLMFPPDVQEWARSSLDHWIAFGLFTLIIGCLVKEVIMPSLNHRKVLAILLSCLGIMTSGKLEPFLLLLIHLNYLEELLEKVQGENQYFLPAYVFLLG